jgi:hypothetical protein
MSVSKRDLDRLMAHKFLDRFDVHPRHHQPACEGVPQIVPAEVGDCGAAGNPPSGRRTSYLWEEVWERESFLEILGRYLVTEKDPKTKKLTRYIFPRYHQLAVTRKLFQAVKAEGAGGKYLIQHSDGSGKTNSIAWTAHFFADLLHDAEHHKVFDSVIVVSTPEVNHLSRIVFAYGRLVLNARTPCCTLGPLAAISVAFTFSAQTGRCLGQ